ncbi:flavodoxin family protein [bacterium]|nr:flavodoxin family protein [bacterium]
MRITILDGDPEALKSKLGQYVEQLQVQLAARGHEVSCIHLRELSFGHCTGCFGCWVKTPGECVIDDDFRNVCRAFVNSDLVIAASPITMGFVSSLLRRANERLLPILHPYIAFKNGECHHIGRYERYPKIGLILARDDQTDEEDIEIIEAIYRRNAINVNTDLVFTALTDDPVEETCRAIDGH